MTPHFLRKNWLAITGLAIGVAGIVLSVYFYWGSRRFREPIFVEDPIRTELLSHESVAQAPIQVLRSNGEPIESDLVSIRFYFWNAGTEPIRGQHVLEQITLSLDETAVEILDFRLLSISRDITGLALNRNPTNPKRSLVLSFTILETDDGATGQIIYEGSSSSPLTIGGVVEGVRSFTSTADVQSSRTWYQYWTKLLLLLGFLVTGFCAAIAQIWLDEKAKSHRLAKIVRKFIAVAFLVALVAIVAGVLIGLFGKAKEDARKSVAQAVPSEILPD